MARHVKPKDPLLKSGAVDSDNSAPLDEDSSPLETKRDQAKARQMSLKQFATMIGRDRNTCMKYLDQGMPYVEKADRDRGAQWVLDSADCIRWLESRAAQMSAEKLGGGVDGLPTLEVIELRTKAAKMYTQETEMAESIGVVARIHSILSLIKRDYSMLRTRLMIIPDALGAKFDDDVGRIVSKTSRDMIDSALKSLKADADIEKSQAEQEKHASKAA